MAKLGRISLDSDKIDEGVWVPWEEDVELLLAPMHNTKMEAFIRKASSSRMKGFRSRDMDDETMDALTLEAVARFVLIGWKNIQDDDGNDIPWSEEKSLELLRQPTLRHLYKFVQTSSMDQGMFMVEDAGN